MMILTYWMNQFVNAKCPRIMYVSTYWILFKCPRIEGRAGSKNTSHIGGLSLVFQSLLMSLRMESLNLQDRFIISRSIHMQTPKNREGFISQEISRVMTISSLLMALNEPVEFNISWNKKQLECDREQTLFLEGDLYLFPLQSLWTVNLLFTNNHINLLNETSSRFIFQKKTTAAHTVSLKDFMWL